MLAGHHSRDLIVLGGGTAGIVAAKTAAGLGADVLLVERERTGGDCLWTGCVPSKALLAAAESAASVGKAARFGVAADGVHVDFAAVMRHVHSAIQKIEPTDSPETLKQFGISILRGTGKFLDERTLEVDREEIHFRTAIIATGAQPAIPPLPGLEDSPFLTSDSVWQLKKLPKRLVVLGAGSIGCELGQAFARLGSQVTLIDVAPRIMLHDDEEAAAIVAQSLKSDGVQLLTGTTVSQVNIGHDGSGVLEAAVAGSAKEIISFDHLLVATGRTPRTANLGLAAAGVESLERGFLRVDASLRTTNRRIWAAGDVTGHPQFTHVAGVHGSLAASNAVLGLKRKAEVSTIPRVTFTDPEVASVGVSTAGDHNIHFAISRRSNSEVDRAVTEARTDGFTKVAIDKRGRLLGATIVAPRAGEMIAELTLAVRLGLRTRDLASTIHAYPTFADGQWSVAIADVRDRLQKPMFQRFIRLLRQAAQFRSLL